MDWLPRNNRCRKYNQHIDRDPHTLGNILQQLTHDAEWANELAQAQVVMRWSDIVGAANAGHTRVIGIRETTLEIQCDSSAWATQLRMMRGSIVAKIAELFPGAGITDIRIKNPGSPSWNHGIRRVKGRGPRDTYG